MSNKNILEILLDRVSGIHPFERDFFEISSEKGYVLLDFYDLPMFKLHLIEIYSLIIGHCSELILISPLNYNFEDNIVYKNGMNLRLNFKRNVFLDDLSELEINKFFTTLPKTIPLKSNIIDFHNNCIEIVNANRNIRMREETLIELYKEEVKIENPNKSVKKRKYHCFPFYKHYFLYE